MKVLFLSDTHLGFGRRHRDYPERREDAFRGFQSAIEVGKRESVDLFIHGGDLFDTTRPSFDTLTEAVDLLTSLPKNEEGVRVMVKNLKGEELYSLTPERVPFIAVHGNHDWNQNKENNIYTLFERAGLLVYAHRRIVEVQKESETVCIVGMGWIPDKYVEKVIASYPNSPCERSYFLFHQPVKGLYPANPREKLLPPSIFPEGYSLYLAGHLHWIVDRTVGDKRFLIPGSTVITSLKEGEMDRPRIVYILEGDSVKSIELPGVRRAFLVRGRNADEVVKSIRRILEKGVSPPPIVKVVLEGKKEEDVDVDAIRKLFDGEALIYVFDKRETPFLEQIRQIKHDVSGDVFSWESVMTILREKMGDEWEEWMEGFLRRLVEGDEEGAESMLGNVSVSPESHVEKRGGSILDWVST